MKQALKKILPKPVLYAALNMRDRARLNATPRQDFNPAQLKPESAMSAVTALFNDDALAQIWTRDNGAIDAVFSDNFAYGGVNPGDRRALYSLIAGLKAEKVLEVGTHIGASTLYIARALQTVSPTARVETVDILDVNDPVSGPWKKIGLAMPPAGFAEKLGCHDRISFNVAPALDFLKKTNEKFDLIFLDGDHSSRAVYEEVSASLPLLKDNGVILLHDYYPGARPLFPSGNIIPGPFLALERINRENPNIHARPLGNLPWPTKEGSHATSLAIVTRIK